VHELDDADRAEIRGLAAKVSADGDARLVESGLFGLEMPQKFGGGGAAFGELLIVLEALGSHAADSRLLGSVGLCAAAIVGAGSEDQQERWLPGLVSGQLAGTLSIGGLVGESAPIPTVEYRASASEWILNGRADLVLDGSRSDLIVTVASMDGRRALVAVSSTSAGLRIEPAGVLDETRCLDDVTFDDVRVADADVLATDAEVVDRVLGELADRACLAAAADSAGITQRVLDDTVTYVGQREQFGRPIGSFQAVKHQLADLKVALEVSTALLDQAADLVQEGDALAAVTVSMANHLCCHTAAVACGVAIQMHGAIGYTWELGLHRYLKRAKLNEFLFGSPQWHRARIAAGLAEVGWDLAGRIHD